MKKLMSLVLAALMLLSFAACNGSNGNDGQTANATPEPTAEPTAEPIKTKDELLSSSEEISFTEFNNLTLDNIAKAKMQYCSKDVIVTGYARDIEADCVILTPFSGGQVLIDIHLPLEELLTLEKGQKVTIVGHLDDEVEEREEKEGQYSFFYTHYTMKTAYIVNDVFEITGKLLGSNNSFANAFNFAVPPTSNTYGLIYFANGVDTSKYKTGGSDWESTITVNGKMFIDGDVTEAVPVG